MTISTLICKVNMPYKLQLGMDDSRNRYCAHIRGCGTNAEESHEGTQVPPLGAA